MRKYKTLNNIFGWLAFAVAAFTYLATMEPTASLWDCGEFIVSGFKLEVGHPPGAPLFMMVMRFFTLFAPSTKYAAIMANTMSALMSAFTILFLFWNISHLARKFISKEIVNYNLSDYVVVFGSAFVGALAYTFSDTFWFSAVEAEVYATSSLITAVVFWAILKWEECADEPYANRWLVFLAYITGLSVGVHLLNLLAIPAIVFVYYFRKYPISKLGIVKTSLLSILLLGFVIWGLIPGIPKMASWFELPFVNNLGLPVNSGVLFYILILILLISSSIYYTISQKKNYYTIAIVCISIISFMVLWSVASSYLSWSAVVLLALALLALWGLVKFYFKLKSYAFNNTILLCIAMIILGYGSYAMIVIRSSANPPMDQNNPDNIFSLIYYLNRDQYGSHPLLYGQYYNAPVVSSKEELSYVLVGNKYELAAVKQHTKYDSRYTTLFPRMFSSTKDKVDVYKAYVKGHPVTGGQGDQAIVPKFSENLHFFLDYQLGYMYWRYFLWNFAGRQNDLQATKGDPTRGNWISGFKSIDEARLGKQENLPSFMTNNKGHNVYYMLPLLLGLIGLAYQFMKDKKNFTVVALLFFFTGIAIVIYLNQTPNEVRERDYAYAGSFYAFAIWIGLGVMAIYKLLKRFTPSILASSIASISTLTVPFIMCQQNWDDHDRSGCYIASDFGYNYLNSCDKEGIVFVYADNDTFPLWYSQEVEEVRNDLRVANAMYLYSDWYYQQLMRKVNASTKFITTATPDKIAGNRRDQVLVVERIQDPIDANAALNFVMSDDDSKKISIAGTFLGSSKINYFPSKILAKPINKSEVIRDNIVASTDTAYISPALFFRLPEFLIKNNIAILDIIANNFFIRPIYLGVSLPSEYRMGLEPNLQLEGLAYKVVPYNVYQANKTVNIDKTYDLLMNKFKYRGLGEPNVYMGETARRHLSFYRKIFYDLGNALEAAGKLDSLKLLMAKYEEIMPGYTDPLYNINSLVNFYVSLGEKEKVVEWVTKLCDEYNLEIEYYLSLLTQRFNMGQELSIALTGIENLRMMLEGHKDYSDLYIKVKDISDKYSYLLK